MCGPGAPSLANRKSSLFGQGRETKKTYVHVPRVKNPSAFRHEKKKQAQVKFANFEEQPTTKIIFTALRYSCHYGAFRVPFLDSHCLIYLRILGMSECNENDL